MSMRISTNLESNAAILATYEGMVGAMEADQYIQMLCRRAHDKALNAFELDAAAHAMRMKNLRRNMNHMWEYGVAGITPGAMKIADPTSPAARLWLYNTQATRLGTTTMVIFRDAVIPNPKPTERPDLRGVEGIEKMSERKYIFKQRASITESGETVVPKPNKPPYGANALVVPVKNAPRGFVFDTSSGGSPSVPGEYHKGAFFNFWNKWWARPDKGAAVVRQHAHQTTSGTIGGATRRGLKKGTFKPVQTTKVVQAWQAARQQAYARALASAKGKT